MRQLTVGVFGARCSQVLLFPGPSEELYEGKPELWFGSENSLMQKAG